MIGAPPGTLVTSFPEQVAVISQWLHADPTDPGYVDTLTHARGLISQDANLTAPTIARGNGGCAAPPKPIAYTIGGLPSIRLCTCWFDNENAACRVDALIHETYHLMGLHHGPEPFDSADAMSQLVNALDKLSINNCNQPC
jgi:hypothetical protein